MSLHPWETARRTACEAARLAWTGIRDLYASGSPVEQKREGPVTEADRLADRLILERLQRDYPVESCGYLTEETEDDPIRLERERVWIIDPIDGTRDFIRQTGNFTMHVALVERLRSGVWDPVAAAVYRPERGEMYSAVRGVGAQIEPHAENQPSGPPHSIRVSARADIEEMKAVISFSHRTKKLNSLMDALPFAEVLSVGSLGIKLTLIAEGSYDFYVLLERGRSCEWDICAPDLILSEAGGLLTDLDGNAIGYNKPSVLNAGGLIASNNRMHAELVRRVSAFEAAYKE